MGVRAKNGKLFLDFRWRGVRCRESVDLDDTPENRRRCKAFFKIIAGEIALGTALLTPFVPSGLAGHALAGFSGGLTRLYWTAPGLRQSGSVRPTQQGIPIAKDTWLLAIGLALVLDAVLDRLPGRRRHR